MLSDKFDGYAVTMMITDTAKTSSGYDNNEIRATVERADWWPDLKASVNANITGQKFYIVGNVDADANLFQSGKAIFVTNDYDEKELVYFAASGKTDIKEFDAADFVKNADVGSNSFSNTSKIRFDSKYYTMNTNTNGVDIYVNGAEYLKAVTKTTAYIDTTLDKLLGNAQGTVTFIKSESDNGYSKIFVNYYEVAEVAAVNYKTSATTINFTINNGLTGTVANKLVINDDAIEDGDVDVKVMLGDQEIGLSDIQEDDIIAIKADLSLLTAREVKDPNFVEILVSRDTASGKLMSINTDDEEITLESKTYTAVDFSALSGDSRFAVGEIFEVTIDPFGRIYDYDATESTKLYAILEKVNTSSDTVTLVMGDGSYKAFDLAGTGTATLTTASAVLNGSAYDAAYSTNICSASVEKVAPQYRVVEYTVKSSTGAISSLTVKAAYAGSTNNVEEFNARTNKIGSFAVNDNTKILNATNYVKKEVSGEYKNGAIGDYKTLAVASLADGEEYTSFAFNKVGSYYSFIVVTKAGQPINASSRFAVARGTVSKGTASNGDQCYTMDALYDGQEVTLELADTVYVNGNAEIGTAVNDVIDTGDAFFFETDSDNMIEKIYTVYEFAGKTTNDYSSMTSAFKGGSNLTGAISTTDWEFGLQNASNKDMQVAFGVITARNSNSVDLGVVVNNQINKNKADDQTTLQGVYNFSYADDCVAYTYDLSDTTLKTKEALVAESSAAAIKASTFKLFENASDSEIIDWTITGDSIENYANYALVQLVDDEVVAIYEIVR